MGFFLAKVECGKNATLKNEEVKSVVEKLFLINLFIMQFDKAALRPASNFAKFQGSRKLITAEERPDSCV